MNAVEALVVVRDLGCCVRCVRCGRHVAHLDRGVAWSIHHRRPRGTGGTSLEWVNAPANLVVLCGSGTTGCHGQIESHRTAAREYGYLISQNGRLVAVDVPIVHFTLGRVLLTDEGGWKAVDGSPEPDAWTEKAA